MQLNLSKDFPILIDTEAQSQILKWWSSDTEESYNKNLKSGWEYENSEDLVYKFNKWGYRTKSIDDLDEDFALIFGCSYTEGVGLYQKDIWCEKLCKELGIDLFNLAKQGSSPAISYMNTILYIKNLIKYKPKLVIYQWPQIFRKTFTYTDGLNNSNLSLNLVNYNVNTDASNEDSRWYETRWLKEYGEMYKDSFFHFYSTDVLWKALNVPVYHWTWSGDFEIGGEMWNYRKLDRYNLPFLDNEVRIIMNKSNDRARDDSHDGKQIHSDVVDFLIDDVRKLL